jgi:hypothetical protein
MVSLSMYRGFLTQRLPGIKKITGAARISGAAAFL